MKRVLYTFFLVLIATSVFAQDFKGAKIYINPGHGGHDSDDRYIPATGFWESEGNLSKGLDLRDILQSYNANVRMSRTLNRTEDDLGLSVIDADANSYDADYFHAIHSNAWDAKSNYTLVLLRGFDSGPYNGDTTWAYSYKMGGYIWDNINATKTGAWSATSKMVRGDISFYRSSTDAQVPYLGVLKTLTMPGTLSEGSFHAR